MLPKLAIVLAVVIFSFLGACHATYDEPLLSNVIASDEVGGHFALAPGVLANYEEGYGFDYRQEYSPGMASVYLKYLKRPTKENEVCHGAGHFPHYAEGDLGSDSFEASFQEAGNAIEEYESITQSYLASDPRGMNFSAFVYLNALHAKYNELLTESIKTK